MILLAGSLAVIGVLLVGARTAPRPARIAACTPRRPRGGGRRVTRWRGALVRAIVVMTVMAIGGPFGAVAALSIIAVRPRLQRGRAARRRAAQTAVAYPDFVDLLVLSIKAGYTPVQALTLVADVVPASIQPAITHVLRETEAGRRFADALGDLAHEPPVGLGSVARPLVDSLTLADRYGTPLATTLDRLGDEARAQRRRNADAAARQLPIKLSFPLVGCTLPSFVLLTIVPLMAGTLSSLRGLTP